MRRSLNYQVRFLTRFKTSSPQSILRLLKLGSGCLSRNKCNTSLWLSLIKVCLVRLLSQMKATRNTTLRKPSQNAQTQQTHAKKIHLVSAALSRFWIEFKSARSLLWGSLDAKKERLLVVLTKTFLCMQWGCAITAITSTAETQWLPSVLTPVRDPSTQRGSARAATSTTTTRCAEERRSFSINKLKRRSKQSDRESS